MQDFQYKVMIREHHLDTFGHVNNATYLTLLEDARWELLTQSGYGMAQVMGLKQGPVILELNLKYLKELRLRETIGITIELVDYHGKVGHLKQQMLKEDGSVAVEALFTFGLFDLKSRRLIEPTPEWRKALRMS